MPPTEAPASWPPLGRKCPSHWVPARQAMKLLTHAQRAFVAQLNERAEQGTKAAAEEGIALLDTVPHNEAHALDLVTLRSRMLSQLGHYHMAYAVIFDQLFTLESEALWLDRGHMVEEWLRANLTPEDEVTQRARDGLLQQLDALCKRSKLLAPRLLLAFAWSQGEERPPQRARLLLGEALEPNRWRRHFKHAARIDPWIEHLAGGFFAYIEYLLSQGEDTRAALYGRHILDFPWESSARMTPNALHLLCLPLLQLEMWQQQRRLCERVQKQQPTWGEPSFWLGRLALQQEQPAQALRHFHAALESGDLKDPQKRSIARGLLQLQELDAARAAIDLLDAKESVDALQLDALHALYQEDLPTALRHCESILAQAPDNRVAALHKVSILVGLGRVDEAEALLLPWRHHEDLALQLFAHLLLGDIYLQRDQPIEALASFQRLLTPPLHYERMLDGTWQRGFLLSLGESLERTGNPTAALARYEEALALQPSRALVNRVLWLLLQQERYDDASHTAARYESTQDDTAPSPWYLYARLQLAERSGHWDTCLDLLQTIGQPWLEAQDLLIPGLASTLRATMAAKTPWEAMMACEAHLPLILTEPSLLALRKQAVTATQELLDALTAQLGQKEAQLRAMETLRSSLQQEIKESQLQAETFEKILKQHKELREERRPFHTGAPALVPQEWGATGTSQALDAPQPTWLRQHPALLAQLPTNAQAIFRSAAMLWDRFAADENEDHAPVVLQLARLVESEVNRRLVDPLVAVALEAGFSLHDLPTPKSSRLLPEKNRISLSDAAYLLYQTLSQREPDGSVSMVRNPRSPEKHAALLAAYWGHAAAKVWQPPQRRYIQHQLPLDLQALAKARNPASHAGAEIPPPLPRHEAQTIQALALGSAAAPGILLRLTPHT